MQRNRALLREIENTNQPSFIPTDVLRVHKGIAQEFKFKARNQNAHDIVVYNDQQWIVCIIHL